MFPVLNTLMFGAALPKPKSANDTVGVHTHGYRAHDCYEPLMDRRDYDAMQAGGLRVLRTDCLWGAVEQQQGKYDFSKYDALVKACKARGIRPMMILGLGNGLYGEGLTAYPQTTADAFTRYAKAAVAHFKGKGIIWELVQQPNQAFFWQPEPNARDYVALAKQLLPELQQIDPTAIFVAPSLAGHDLAYQEACYQEGLLEVADAVSVHPYRSAARTPESIEENYRKSQALIKQYAPEGKDIPVILGEWGYHTLEVDPDTQADYAVRQYLIGMMLGTPINIWHDWKGDIFDVTDDPANPEQLYGFVNKDLEPKPVFDAVKRMLQALEDQSFKARVASSPGDYLLIFEGNGKKTLVAWTTENPHKVKHNEKTLTLSGKPVFIPLAE
ncbi:MAG: cellulase family glycosylhydrolase [Candidatus Melainabacteria bacterium]